MASASPRVTTPSDMTPRDAKRLRVAFDGTPEQAMSQLTALDPWVAFCHAHGLSMLTPEQAAGRLDD